MIAVFALPAGSGEEIIPTLSESWTKKLDEVERRWGDKCRKYGAKYGVPDGVGQAHILRESGGNENVISHDGGVGLMQITNLALKGGHSDKELLDPDLNMDIGFRYLGILWKKYDGDFPKVSAAYNAGSVKPSTWNPWGMVQTSGHVSFEVAAYNTYLSRQLSEETRREILANIWLSSERSSDDFAKGSPFPEDEVTPVRTEPDENS